MFYVPDTPLQLAHRLWQVRPPQPSLTVVVKGTFDPRPDAPAVLAEEQIPPTGELYYDDDVERSLRTPSDFALLKPCGECFVVGKAWTPDRRPERMLACSFRIGPVSRRFAVIGDRRWEGRLVAEMTDPRPFTEMDLAMERAYGGKGHSDNPYGRGREEVQVGDEWLRPLPNLEDPSSLVSSPGSKPDPIVLGPLPQTWPARRKLAGTYDDRYVAVRWPWLPEDFDWRYFLEAPPDQRIKGFWKGDEPLEAHNLHPTEPAVRTRLPGIAPRVFLHRKEPDGGRAFEEVPLKLDTVTWEAELGKLVLVWRGLTEVPSESLDEVPHIFVAHEPLEAPRDPMELRLRFEALIAEELAAEAEAEGKPPPPADVPTGDFDAMPPTQILPDEGSAGASAEGAAAGFDEDAPTIARPSDAEPADTETGYDADAPTTARSTDEELELQRKMEELEAKLADVGVVAVGESPPESRPDPAKILEVLKASGVEVPPELEAMAKELMAAEETTTGPSDFDYAPETVYDPLAGPSMRDRVKARMAVGEPLKDLDLSGVDLSHLDLGGQDLSGMLLRDAKLIESRLDGAKLNGAVLAGADLTRATLIGAELVESDLAGVDATGADLTDANLEDADLEDARLTRAKLGGARAARAVFARADLTEALLADADLTEAALESTCLLRTDFRRCKLIDATLEKADAREACFDAAEMTRCRGAGLKAPETRFHSITADDSFWENAQLARSDFAFAHLERADFSDAVLVGTNFDGCSMAKARFDRANAHGMRARRADLGEANFESAVLSSADLRGANLYSAELWRAKTDAVQIELADVTCTLLEA